MRLILCCLLAIITAGCTKVTSIRHSVGYEYIVSKSNKFLILPPLIEVNTVDIAHKKTRMYNYEIYLEDLIKEQLVAQLQKKAFRVTILHKKNIKEQDLYDILMCLRRSYNASRDELYKPLLWEEKKAFVIEKNLGKEAILLGEKTDSNILVFVDYMRNVKTNGARVRDLAMNVLFALRDHEDADSAVMLISFVDAKNGNVLWSNMEKVTESIYSSMFESSSNKKVDIKHLDNILSLTLLNFKSPK